MLYNAVNLIHIIYYTYISLCTVLRIDQENYGFWIFHNHLKTGLCQKCQLEHILTAAVMLSNTAKSKSFRPGLQNQSYGHIKFANFFNFALS